MNSFLHTKPVIDYAHAINVLTALKGKMAVYRWDTGIEGWEKVDSLKLENESLLNLNSPHKYNYDP